MILFSVKFPLVRVSSVRFRLFGVSNVGSRLVSVTCGAITGRLTAATFGSVSATETGRGFLAGSPCLSAPRATVKLARRLLGMAPWPIVMFRLFRMSSTRARTESIIVLIPTGGGIVGRPGDNRGSVGASGTGTGCTTTCEGFSFGQKYEGEISYLGLEL